MPIFDIPLKWRLTAERATNTNGTLKDFGDLAEVMTIVDTGKRTGLHNRPIWRASVEFELSMRSYYWRWGSQAILHPISAGVFTAIDLAQYSEEEHQAHCPGATDVLCLLREIEDRIYNSQWDNWRLHVILPDDESWKLGQGLKLIANDYSHLPESWKSFELFKGSVMDPQSPDYHFPHVSVHDTAMVAFVEDNEKGNRGINLRIKPGKYIARFFGEKLKELHGENKANAIIAKMAAEFGSWTGNYGMKWAKTPDEIEHVYTNGPSSCMSHDICEYPDIDEHPVRVLGAGDLAVAYLERGSRVTARALTWPEKKTYVRIYGDAERLKPILDEQGFRAGGPHCWEGAKLLKINTDNGVIVPYIDGHSTARSEKDHLVIDRSGGISLSNTCGWAEAEFECHECKEVKGPHFRMEYHDHSYCRDCFSRVFWQCAHSCAYHRHDQQKPVMVEGQAWSQSAADHYSFICDKTGERAPTRGSVQMHNGQHWSSRAFARYGRWSDEVRGRALTIEEHEAEYLARKKRQAAEKRKLEEAMFLKKNPDLVGLFGDDLRKAMAAAKRREQRAAKKARELAEPYNASKKYEIGSIAYASNNRTGQRIYVKWDGKTWQDA